MKNGNILITDDDQTLCYLLKEELINEGFNVDITFDGKYAIENLKKKSYDVMDAISNTLTIIIPNQMASKPRD